MSNRFGEVRDWIRDLEDGSREHRGFGYAIEWTEIEHRQLGRNRLPAAIVVPTLEDALKLVGRQRHAERFQALAAATLDAHPEAKPWLEKRPLVALEHADDWPKILAVLAWFRAHPRPGIYLRQLDIRGVDTKFIERHKVVLTELLDCVLTADAVRADARPFEARFGLRTKPALVRFRVLDARHHVQGLSDIATPAEQFARLDLPVERVFITENEINGLAFPEVPSAIAIFGLGYGLDRLADVGWLRDKAIFYWGDIDTHGFAILNRLRSAFPDARSLLMDRTTLMEHESLWVEEDARQLGALSHLTDHERALFEDLAGDRLGVRVRLEQERIRFGWAEEAIVRAVG